jgi:predicted esterase
VSGDPPATGPHQGQPVLAAGAPLAEARAALLMVHGRGASAADILTYAGELARPGLAMLAPQAAGNAWYPASFMAPLAANEPDLSSALALLDALVARIAAAGVPAARTVLLGFSQGACLALEYAARHARRYGGLVGWSGGLIGPDDAPRDYAGSLDGTPVFLGCGNADPYIPTLRVTLSASVLRRLGGDVTARLYPGLGHTVNQDELDAARAIVAAVAG